MTMQQLALEQANLRDQRRQVVVAVQEHVTHMRESGASDDAVLAVQSEFSDLLGGARIERIAKREDLLGTRGVFDGLFPGTFRASTIER
jgi:hypothetical protein